NYDVSYVSYAQGLLSDLPPALTNLSSKYVQGGRDNAPETGRLLSPDMNESQYLPASLQPQGSSPSAEHILLNLTELTPHTQILQGVAVTATAKTATQKVAVGASGGGFALTLAGGANLTVATTRAFIDDNARVNQDHDAMAGAGQSVLVGAGTADAHLSL